MPASATPRSQHQGRHRRAMASTTPTTRSSVPMSYSPSTMPRSRKGASRRSAEQFPECLVNPSSVGSIAAKKPSAFPRAGHFLQCIGFGCAAFPGPMVSSLRASTPTFLGWKVRSGVGSSLLRMFYSTLRISDGAEGGSVAKSADNEASAPWGFSTSRRR